MRVHPGSQPVFGRVCGAHLFSFLCCVVMCVCGVFNFIFVFIYFFFVRCIVYPMQSVFLWIVHSSLPLRFSPTFIIYHKYNYLFIKLDNIRIPLNKSRIKRNENELPMNYFHSNRINIKILKWKAVWKMHLVAMSINLYVYSPLIYIQTNSQSCNYATDIFLFQFEGQGYVA